MKIQLCLAEKIALGLIILVALPYFLILVASVYFYNNALECFIVHQAAIDCFAQMRPFYFGLLALWIGAVIISGVLVFIFFRDFVNPIEKLSEIASDIAAGKSRPIPYLKVRGRNEVARLYDVIRNMSDNLINNIKKLETANKFKSEFISIASHQLRTPLSAIKWLVEMLLENGPVLTAGQKETLQNIYKSNERLIALVADLLNVGKLEAGKITARRELSNIENLIKSEIELCKTEAEMKNIKINLKLETDIKEILLDPLLFIQGVRNILDNAVIYSPENTKVDVTISSQKGNYVIAIHNDGPSIPEIEHDRLFTKFYRGPVAQRMKPGGSGLGLFIAKLAIESLGGVIWFDSPIHENSGVTFYISIPQSIDSRNQ